MTVQWSDRSIDRLMAIHDYVASDSPNRAVRIIEEIFEYVERIRLFPNSGRIVPEYEHVDVREIIQYPYRLLYRVSNDRIDIINILHVSQRL